MEKKKDSNNILVKCDSLHFQRRILCTQQPTNDWQSSSDIDSPFIDTTFFLAAHLIFFFGERAKSINCHLNTAALMKCWCEWQNVRRLDEKKRVIRLMSKESDEWTSNPKDIQSRSLRKQTVCIFTILSSSIYFNLWIDCDDGQHIISSFINFSWFPNIDEMRQLFFIVFC